MGPLGQKSVPDEERFRGACIHGLLMGKDVGQEPHALDVAPGPALVGHLDNLDSAGHLIDMGRERASRGKDGERRILWGKAMGAGCDAPGYLDVDGGISVNQGVFLDELSGHLLQGFEFRFGKPKCSGPVMQPFHVGPGLEEPAAVTPDDLVEAIGEKESPVIG